jgi:hypothetical protein
MNDCSRIVGTHRHFQAVQGTILLLQGLAKSKNMMKKLGCQAACGLSQVNIAGLTPDWQQPVALARRCLI